MSALHNISFGVIFESVWYFGESISPNIIYIMIEHLKIERNYCYYKHKMNLRKCIRREEESMLLISRAKLSESQG